MDNKIKASDILDFLKKSGYTFASGVPCSILKELLEELYEYPGIRYVPAVRENVALGLASGAYLAGKDSCIFMQNSGLGNVVNALTSFNIIYKIPILMFITWRGFEGKDAPEHIIMGDKMCAMLEMLDIPYRVLTDSYKDDIAWAMHQMKERHIPAAIIVKKGSIT